MHTFYQLGENTPCIIYQPCQHSSPVYSEHVHCIPVYSVHVHCIPGGGGGGRITEIFISRPFFQLT